MGALMGALAFIFYLLLGTLGFALSIFLRHNGNEIREGMVKQIQQAAAKTPDPQVQEMIRWFTTTNGLMVLIAAGLFMLFVIFLISGTAAGAAAGAVARKKPDQ
jgi:hypothetical protein